MFPHGCGVVYETGSQVMASANLAVLISLKFRAKNLRDAAQGQNPNSTPAYSYISIGVSVYLSYQILINSRVGLLHSVFGI